jgi:mono/diheme cytochrome c family protein
MAKHDLLIALTPILAGVVLAAAVAAVDPPRRVSGTDRYEIPAGTAERVRQGLPVSDVLPERIETTVGRSLVVENQDTVNHVFGPFVLAPGQQWTRQFAAAGDYRMDCSVYPATGFTIAVAAAPAAAGPAQTLSAVLLVAWMFLGAAVLGVGGLALVGASPGPARSGALGSLRTGGLLLPGTILAVLMVNLVALARLAPWRPVLASPVAMAGLIAVVLAAGATLYITQFLDPAQGPGLGRIVLALPVVALAVGAGLWLGVRWDAPARTLLVAGAGLLLVALVAGLVRPTAAWFAAPSERRWLAAAGLGLFVAGLPWPTGNPALWGLAGAIALVAALALAGLAVWGRGHAAPDGAVWLAAAAAIAAAAWAAAVLVLATAAHIEATAIPLYGNPVAADAASVGRGRDLWTRECTECHERPGDVDLTDLSDRDVIAVITQGARATKPGEKDMPGYAYRLDMTARGDLANYLRAAVNGTATPTAGG